ncbi:proline-rich protein 36-like [Desmodus rotundus]|uniref:proline-rich protein 36-like n=1 Tax=Desmodus rotundus TaxID=9430 RepID=UPI0039E281A5
MCLLVLGLRPRLWLPEPHKVNKPSATKEIKGGWGQLGLGKARKDKADSPAGPQATGQQGTGLALPGRQQEPPRPTGGFRGLHWETQEPPRQGTLRGAGRWAPWPETLDLPVTGASRDGRPMSDGPRCGQQARGQEEGPPGRDAALATRSSAGHLFHPELGSGALQLASGGARRLPQSTDAHPPPRLGTRASPRSPSPPRGSPLPFLSVSEPNPDSPGAPANFLFFPPCGRREAVPPVPSAQRVAYPARVRGPRSPLSGTLCGRGRPAPRPLLSAASFSKTNIFLFTRDYRLSAVLLIPLRPVSLATACSRSDNSPSPIILTHNAPCCNFDEPVTSKALKSSDPITHISTPIFTTRSVRSLGEEGSRPNRWESGRGGSQVWGTSRRPAVAWAVPRSYSGLVPRSRSSSSSSPLCGPTRAQGGPGPPARLAPGPARTRTHPNCAAACGGACGPSPLQARGEERGTAGAPNRAAGSGSRCPPRPRGRSHRGSGAALDLRGCTLGPQLPPPPSLPAGTPPPLTSTLSISLRLPPPVEGVSRVPRLRGPRTLSPVRAAAPPPRGPVPSPRPSVPPAAPGREPAWFRLEGREERAGGPAAPRDSHPRLDIQDGTPRALARPPRDAPPRGLPGRGRFQTAARTEPAAAPGPHTPTRPSPAPRARAVSSPGAAPSGGPRAAAPRAVCGHAQHTFSHLRAPARVACACCRVWAPWRRPAPPALSRPLCPTAPARRGAGNSGLGVGPEVTGEGRPCAPTRRRPGAAQAAGRCFASL